MDRLDAKHEHRTAPEPEPITPGRYLGTHGVSTLWPVEYGLTSEQRARLEAIRERIKERAG